MSKRLDSRSLQLFLAVATAGNFRQAAETLNMSQPPLSRAIKSLEERLGVRLFDRDTQGAVLTRVGKKLVPRAQHIIELICEAENDVLNERESTLLRLGITTALELPWLPALMERIKIDHPRMNVVIVSDTSPRLVRALGRNRIDAAVIATPTAVGDLSVTSLDRQRMMIAIPSVHRLARRRIVELADLAGEPIFLFERARQPSFFDHCQAVFAQHAITPKFVAEPADHHVLLAGVASGRAFALLPASFMSIRRSGVSYKRLKEGEVLSIGIGLATPKDLGALHNLLLSCVRDAVGGLPAGSIAS